MGPGWLPQWPALCLSSERRAAKPRHGKLGLSLMRRVSPVGTTRVYDLDGVVSGYVAYPTFRFSGPVFLTTAEGPTCGRWGGAKGQSLSLAKAAPERPA
jgi:hypothetical protein